jgi:predicted TIM-barrel fold metal-dependent hydrolase
MTIDIHAHYVPAELIARIRSNKALGVYVVDGAQTPALTFEYGFTVRPFFAKLVEDMRQRIAWLDGERIDYQLVATWPDIYGYGLSYDKCVAWHCLLNDTLAAWCNDNTRRFGFIASVPLPNAANAAAELARAIGLGARGIMVPANVEGTNIGELPLDPLWAKAEESGYPRHCSSRADRPGAARRSAWAFLILRITGMPWVPAQIWMLPLGSAASKAGTIVLIIRHGHGQSDRTGRPRDAGYDAYMGLLEIGKPAAGETVVVAAASGAVGSVVGQIARIKGARAGGIAGGPDKCRYVTEELAS